MWIPITHDTVNEVAYDTENFTSRAVVVSVGRPGDLALPAPIGGAPPITSDPPFHNMARRLLLPAFAPKMIEPWEPEISAALSQSFGAGFVGFWVAVAGLIPKTLLSSGMPYKLKVPPPTRDPVPTSKRVPSGLNARAVSESL